jgi:hypothetical protein
LANNVGYLAYNKTAEVIDKLADSLINNANEKLFCGDKLAKEMYYTALKLYQARDEIDLAWEICQPYM